MASVFSHAVAALALGAVWESRRAPLRFWVLGAFCAAAPDLDVVGFWIGVPYEHPLGHRGLTHSLAFAALLAWVVVAGAFWGSEWEERRLWLWGYFTCATASHGVLDAMTNGGLGVAFFAPYDNVRYFLPLRPIHVSPIGIDAFLSRESARILVNEFVWIWLPCALLLGGRWWVRRRTAVGD